MPEHFYKDNRPIPTRHLSGITEILKENYFQFSGKHYLQTHGGHRDGHTETPEIAVFFEQASLHHPTINSWPQYLSDT